jgi:hypothetical protein
MRKIPVFYHIPKNAGTYVINWMLIAFRHYRRAYTDWLKNHTPEKDSIKCLQITSEGFIIAKFLIGDPNYFCETFTCVDKKHSNTEWDIDIKNLSKDLFKNVFLFGVVIEARGFRSFDHILKVVDNYNLHQFIILRDSFSRAQSFYNYITSDSSTHERTHGLVKSDTFEKYVLSEKLEDSWLIRNLVNIKDCTAINESYYAQTINILNSFNVYNIKNTDNAIREVFNICYGFDTKNIELKSWDNIAENKTKHKKINIEELSKQAQEVFKKRTFWDQKIYEQFK